MSRRATRSIYLDWLGRVLRPADATRGGDAADGAPDQAGDLVLGYATGYGVAHVSSFVRSLRAVYVGPAALFVSPDPALAAFLAEHGVEALSPAVNAEWTPLPVVARFADYARTLADRPWVRQVILTDVRDVVFQAPPFAPPPEKLEAFVEDEQHRLVDHGFQIKYLRLLMGDGLTDAISDQPSLCAGVIVGPNEAVGRLCRLILMLGAIPRSAVSGGFGVDQASLNAAVHYGLIEAAVVPNFSRVATIGMSREGVTTADGRIVNRDGSISPIVHQYDRHPDFIQAVAALWGDGTPERVAKGRAGLGRRLRQLRASLSVRLPELR